MMPPSVLPFSVSLRPLRTSNMSESCDLRGLRHCPTFSRGPCTGIFMFSFRPKSRFYVQ